mmetsp:Transcript_104137/g.277069  ORF Transcript_104137/g.277069 Transcript_104137/m.277069 type:complete len:259 (-) Transcript_104137:184-960(-)
MPLHRRHAGSSQQPPGAAVSGEAGRAGAAAPQAQRGDDDAGPEGQPVQGPEPEQADGEGEGHEAPRHVEREAARPLAAEAAGDSRLASPPEARRGAAPPVGQGVQGGRSAHCQDPQSQHDGSQVAPQDGDAHAAASAQAALRHDAHAAAYARPQRRRRARARPRPGRPLRPRQPHVLRAGPGGVRGGEARKDQEVPHRRWVPGLGAGRGHLRQPGLRHGPQQGGVLPQGKPLAEQQARSRPHQRGQAHGGPRRAARLC